MVYEHLNITLLIRDYSSLFKVDLGAYRDFYFLMKHLEKKIVLAHTFKITL